MNSSLLCIGSAFAAAAFVAVAMFIQVTRCMARMIVVLPAFSFCPDLSRWPCSSRSPSLCPVVIVMLAWFSVGHVGPPQRVKSWSQRTATLIGCAAIIRRTRWLASLRALPLSHDRDRRECNQLTGYGFSCSSD